LSHCEFYIPTRVVNKNRHQRHGEKNGYFINDGRRNKKKEGNKHFYYLIAGIRHDSFGVSCHEVRIISPGSEVLVEEPPSKLTVIKVIGVIIREYRVVINDRGKIGEQQHTHNNMNEN
jgi:hypothetical protein